MPQEFEDQDLTDAVFWGVRLRNARFRDADFTGARAHHVLLKDVEIDGFVDGLVINGVDVTDYVNANDPWQPLRGMIRPTDMASVRAAWDETERTWDAVLAKAAALTDDQRRQSIDGEWSFIETLRHLIFANDKWFTAPIAGGTFDAIGIPNQGSADFPWPDLDPDADPTYDEVLMARRKQGEVIRSAIDGMTDQRLGDKVEVLENGTVTVLDCWHTVFEEAFEHHRYALRDLSRVVGEGT